MANVTNNHGSPLHVGGITIPAGKTAKVENWTAAKGNRTIQSWMKLKVISVEGDEPEADKTKSPSDPVSSYSVKQTSPGWLAVFQGDDQVTKGLRKDDLEGFDDKSDEDKAAFVEAYKAD